MHVSFITLCMCLPLPGLHGPTRTYTDLHGPTWLNRTYTELPAVGLDLDNLELLPTDSAALVDLLALVRGR
jgi:hypothetical protein